MDDDICDLDGSNTQCQMQSIFISSTADAPQAQLPGGQISPSENYENLSRPLSLQIPIAMGILAKGQERNLGVPPPRSKLLPCIYWPDRGSTGI